MREYGIGMDSGAFVSTRRDGLLGDNGARVLVEQLRYMGVVSNREGHSRFIVPAPRGVTARESYGWALRNMARIHSFSIPAILVSRDTRGGDWAAEDDRDLGVGNTYLYPRDVSGTEITA